MNGIKLFSTVAATNRDLRMTIEMLIIGLLLVAAAGVGGFYFGRGATGDRARLALLEAELVEAEKKLQDKQDGIDEHFEESAELFGRLAQDYRALFQHFANDAAKLGLGDARSQLILDAVRERLLTDDRPLETSPGDFSAVRDAEGSGSPEADVAQPAVTAEIPVLEETVEEPITADDRERVA